MAEHDDDSDSGRKDNNDMTDRSSATLFHKDLNDKNEQERRMRYQVIKKWTLYKIVLVLSIFAVIFVSTRIVAPLFLKEDNYLLYFYLAEVAIAGSILIRMLGELVFRILFDVSRRQATSSRSIITIAGYLAIVSIIVAILAKDPTITVAISTITGIVLGISAQSLIGNAISGMVLAVSRPFRIGDRVMVFGNTGIVEDIGLLYTRITTLDRNILMAPNTTLLTTAVLKLNVETEGSNTDTTHAA